MALLDHIREEELICLRGRMADGYCQICGGIFCKNRKPAYYRYIIKKKGEKRNGKIYSNAGKNYPENKKRR